MTLAAVQDNDLEDMLKTLHSASLAAGFATFEKDHINPFFIQSGKQYRRPC